MLFQDRRREFPLKSPGIKPQIARHNLVSSQQNISSAINGSFSAGSSTSSLFGSASTLSSRRHVPSNLPTTTNGDDEMEMDSLSSGTTTPMTTPTTDSEFNMEDDSSVFSATISTNTSGFVSS